jgi:2-oxoglutarate dehydrogenase E2 component (dihydrolipoamide succinyltransferase)
MPIELKVPTVGESITEVLLVRWFKNEGEHAEKDEPLVEIETDKATFELPAPAAGTLSQIVKMAGDPAEVGELIAYFETGEAAPAEAAPAEPQPQQERTSSEQVAEADKPPAAGRPLVTAAPPQPAARPETPTKPTEPPRVMPAARREMEQRGVKPEEVQPTGPGGRITKEDVARQARQAPLAERPATERRPDIAQPTAKPTPKPEPQTAAGTVPPGNREEDVVPMSPMRKRIAERLVQAQQNAALLTTFNEVDMSAVVALRQQHRDAFEKKYNVKLGFMSFFVKACVESLKQFPQINAEIHGTDIVYHNYFDIGIAVSGGKGLVVPVLRNAERMSFAQVESTIADFANRARDNKISLDELKGGTFTITNGGVFGSLLSTPIINPPQSGILGLHAMQDRPVAREGQVVIRPMMYIALTYDHRLVDGREAVTFLRRIKEIIEEPSRMLIEI